MPCEFELYVTKKAGHLRFTQNEHGKIECTVTHPPVSDAANKEILKAIAEAVETSLSKVTLVHGVQDYLKLIKISDHHITMEHVLEGLGLSKRSKGA